MCRVGSGERIGGDVTSNEAEKGEHAEPQTDGETRCYLHRPTLQDAWGNLFRGLDFLPQGAEDLELDAILRPPGGALHPHQIFEPCDANH